MKVGDLVLINDGYRGRIRDKIRKIITKASQNSSEEVVPKWGIERGKFKIATYNGMAREIILKSDSNMFSYGIDGSSPAAAYLSMYREYSNGMALIISVLEEVDRVDGNYDIFEILINGKDARYIERGFIQEADMLSAS